MNLNGYEIVQEGKIAKIARVFDEDWIDLNIAESNPEEIIDRLNHSKTKVDIFTFSQRLPHTTPNFSYPVFWENVAAVPITDYDGWWMKRLPQVTRKSIRRSAKRGLEIRYVEFSDELVEGIMGINNDAAFRQGVPFIHYGKDFDTVKREYATFLDRSDFIGAYYNDELIGILKLVHMKEMSSILQIMSKDAHYDKRPTNAMIAKAVEICVEKKAPFLIYGKYIYGNKVINPLTEFKRRNGFERMDIPRYYVPLTARGKMAMRLNLHLRMIDILPNSLINYFVGMRGTFYSKIHPLVSSRNKDKNLKLSVMNH